MKTADISNEARPLDVAAPWLDCLLTEFFNQVFLPIFSTLSNPVFAMLNHNKV